MTDSQSMLVTLSRQTEERIAVLQREIGLLRAGTMRVKSIVGESEQDVSAEWLARLEEWVEFDTAHLARLHG